MMEGMNMGLWQWAGLVGMLACFGYISLIMLLAGLVLIEQTKVGHGR